MSKLGEFLHEASNWDWEEFVRAEKDPKYTTNQSIVFALIRACAMQEMNAIKLAINRLDGKLKTPLRIEMPKVYFLYPNAQALTTGPQPTTGLNTPHHPDPTPLPTLAEGEIIPPEKIESTEVSEEEINLPSLSIRETLQKMADYPRELPQAIIDLALQTDQWVRGKASKPDEIPRVKSVVAANLLILGQKRNMDAMYEIFDNIDGKLVETIQVLGEDIYITSYASDAPEGALPNKDGVLQLEATQTQEVWADKLKDKKWGQ